MRNSKLNLIDTFTDDKMILRDEVVEKSFTNHLGKLNPIPTLRKPERFKYMKTKNEFFGKTSSNLRSFTEFDLDYDSKKNNNSF